MLQAIRGFTLIEVIVTLLIVSVVGSMLFQFLETPFLHSADPVYSAQSHAQLAQVMENITSAFKLLEATSASPLTTLQTNIGSEGSNMSNSYGTYKVVTNHLITFSGTPGVETASASGNFLKVKISCNNFTVTTLFAK